MINICDLKPKPFNWVIWVCYAMINRDIRRGFPLVLLSWKAGSHSTSCLRHQGKGWNSGKRYLTPTADPRSPKKAMFLNPICVAIEWPRLYSWQILFIYINNKQWMDWHKWCQIKHISNWLFKREKHWGKIIYSKINIWYMKIHLVIFIDDQLCGYGMA